MFPNFHTITKEDILLLSYIKYEAQRKALVMLNTQTSTLNQNNNFLLPTVAFPICQESSVFKREQEVQTLTNSQLKQSRKRTFCEREEKEGGKLTKDQKRRKSKREKSRRKTLSDLYFELASVVFSLKLIQKPIRKMQRLELLRSVVRLLGSEEKVESFRRELKTHILVKSDSERASGLSKRKLKNSNEKRRRQKLRFVIDSAGELVGCEKGSEKVEVLRAILRRLRSSSGK